MSLFLRVLAVAAFLLIVPRVALGQDAGVEEARKHFDRGQTLYSVDKFDEAAAEFLKAYESKPFPAFLYNAAVAFEKGAKYDDAVKYFRRYLEKSENAPDKDEVEKRIKILEEIARLKAVKEAPPPPPPNPSNPDASAVAPPPEPTPPSRLEVLPEARTKGLVIVESKPAGATVYIDDKKKGAVGETPWNGTLDGEHTIIIEVKGYQTEKKKISPSADKLLWIYVSLSRDEALGWVEVTANVPGADVYIDDKSVGAVGRTPFRGNVEKGKHKIIVSRTGYQDVVKEVNIEAGKVHKVPIKLAESDVGVVKIKGATAEDNASVKIDGVVVCTETPCKIEAPIGERTIEVSRSGMKPMKKKVVIEKLTETQIKVDLAPKPGRGDAYWQFAFATGFGVGAYYLITQGNETIDDANCEGVDDPCTPDENDEKKGKIMKYGGYGVAGLSGLIFIRGVYFLFRDKGPPSTAIITTRDIAWRPVWNANVAGVEAQVDF